MNSNIGHMNLHTDSNIQPVWNIHLFPDGPTTIAITGEAAIPSIEAEETQATILESGDAEEFADLYLPVIERQANRKLPDAAEAELRQQLAAWWASKPNPQRIQAFKDAHE